MIIRMASILVRDIAVPIRMGNVGVLGILVGDILMGRVIVGDVLMGGI